jgi:hypothetical protein
VIARGIREFVTRDWEADLRFHATMAERFRRAGATRRR